jgi:hypothetical protein
MSSTVSSWTSAASPGPDASSHGFSPEERDYLLSLIGKAFFVRLVVAVLLDVMGLSMRFAPDEETYATTGWQMALYWSGDVYVMPWRFRANQPLGYFYLNSLLFYVFGQTQLPIKILNAFMGALSCRYAYLIGRELFGAAVGRRVALLTAFFPSLILWSALNIRDVWVVFLILYVSWHSLHVVRGYSAVGLLRVLVGVFVLTLFRDYLFLVVALPPVVAFLIGRRGHMGRNFLLALAAGLAMMLIMQQGSVGAGSRRHLSLESLSKARQDLATGGSAIQGDADISTPGKALLYLPVGIAYFLFSPFPWQITSVLKLFSVPEMLLVYALTPAMVRGIRFAVKERFRESCQILMLTGLLTVAYALGEGNVGTLYRHRAQAIVFYLMFAAVGLETKRLAAAAPAAA